MKLNKILIFTLVFFVSTSCGKKQTSPERVNSISPGLAAFQGLPNGMSLGSITGPNVLPLTVNGTTCAAGSYLNKPCVNVTICTPGTATCQTITDILVDTGSYGLRVFSSVLTTPVLTTIVGAGSNPLAECARFGDGSALWGPVKTADVKLGGKTAVTIPIQVIDSTFSTHPIACSSPSTSPSNAGFNGILGVGLFKEDCGSACVSSANTTVYYSCTGSVCSGSVAPLIDQVRNPIADQDNGDNNGVILKLPNISLSGAPSIEIGYMILGVDSQSNNDSAGVTKYPANASGEFTTTYNGTSYDSFIDSGSNALYFPSSTIPDCGDAFPGVGLDGWYCPNSIIDVTATHVGAGGSPSGLVIFPIGNVFDMLQYQNNYVYPEIGGGGLSTSYFDWGLPFYIGRNVYLGLENTTSNLGTGPYWAY